MPSALCRTTQIIISVAACAVSASNYAGPGYAQRQKDDPSVLAAQSPSRGAVEKLIKDSGADVGIAFHMLDGSQELYVNEDTAYHAASTMKLGVLVTLFTDAKSGNLNLNEALEIKNQFKSIVDGSPYQLDVNGDSYAEIYQAVGKSWTLRQLCEVMITKSSNLATNLLIERLGVEHIQRFLNSIGVTDLKVLRGVEDTKAFEAGRNNTTTARALAQILSYIAADEDDFKEEMREILKGQTFNEAIPAGLPSGISVAHKTGEITGIHHDAAIVYSTRPFILVILVKGIEDKAKSSALMIAITKAIYEVAPK